MRYCTNPPTSPPPLCHHQKLPPSRGSLLYLCATLPFSVAIPDTTITDRVFLDLSLCPSYFHSRMPGKYDLSICSDSEPICRLVLGYGNLLPITVSNFKAMWTGSSGSTYKSTSIHNIFPGEFFVASRQGRKDKGEVTPPIPLVRNTETVDTKAFLLEHSRPGVVSLCLSRMMMMMSSS